MQSDLFRDDLFGVLRYECVGGPFDGETRELAANWYAERVYYPLRTHVPFNPFPPALPLDCLPSVPSVRFVIYRRGALCVNLPPGQHSRAGWDRATRSTCPATGRVTLTCRVLFHDGFE